MQDFQVGNNIVKQIQKYIRWYWLDH